MLATYDEWQTRLDKLWFRDRNSHDPVVLFIDETLLASSFPHAEDAVAELAMAINAELSATSVTGIFRPILRRMARWKIQSERDFPPPVLPILALSVLAAVNMVADSRGPANMYYKRLSDVLGETISHTHLRDSFEDVVCMWRTINDWVNEQEWLGESTIVTNERLNRIGYPQSQAVINAQDYKRLYEFFYATSKEVLDELHSSTILQELRRWDERKTHFSPGFRLALHSVDTNRLDDLAQAVFRAARKWNGRRPTQATHHKFSVELWLDLEAWNAHWVVPIDSRVSAFEASSASGEAVKLEVDFSNEVYSSSGLPPVDARTILTRQSWHGTAGELSLDPRRTWTLNPTSVPNSFLSLRTVSQFDELAVLVPDFLSETVEKFLNLHCKSKYKKVQTGQQIIDGWDIFFGIYLQSNESKKEFVELLGLVEDSTTQGTLRPSLVLGLHISTASKLKYFLAGGEPNLFVPPSDGFYTLSIDGSAKMTLKSNGSLLSIADLTASTPGRHTVEIDGLSKLSFSTLDATEVSLSKFINPSRVSSEQAVPENRMLVSRHRRHWFVTVTGEMLAPPQPQIPSWLETRGYSESSLREIYIPSDAVWHLSVNSAGSMKTNRLTMTKIRLSNDAILRSKYAWKEILKSELQSDDSELKNLFLFAGALV